ncbi:DNA polymerase delta subunit 4-like protein [Elsinoe fawcettii]|nr:DNA polymerase delta subunit 4-like protein [Elsinoe fawcettii]
MPPKRSTRASSGRTSGQGTISFGANRITKPTTSPRSAKSKKDPALLAAEIDSVSPPTTDPAISTPLKGRGPPPAADPLTSAADTKTEDVLGGRAFSEPEVEAQDPDEAADDAIALKLPVSKIKLYWAEKERARKAPRVHQEHLPISEKILREWDMSGQYGPCIGISRLRRWRRARKLGLEPPVEVLGVLLGRLEEDEKKGKKSKDVDEGNVEDRAYVDLLMGNRIVAV